MLTFSETSAGPQALILNVNDSEGGRSVVSLTLRKAGFTVIEAESGAKALELMAQNSPALVVLDVDLPDISGLEVCSRIRANPETASLKVLHIAPPLVRLDDKVRGQQGAADGYLTRPFEAEDLLAGVHALLRLDAAEHELGRTNVQLRDTERCKHEFLAMLAHELRNPLAVITAALPILARRAPMDGAEQRAREVLQRQTDHLGRMVDDLLDVARVTQGKIELKREPVELAALLDRVVSGTESTNPRPRDQTLLVTAPDQPICVLGDATRLEQVFTNLLDNACKYTSSGGRIELVLSAGFGPDGTPLARVLVRDDGIGISPEHLPSVFSLFSQGDVPVSRPLGGLGIGLTLVRTLVTLHGGRVTARSGGLGEGSEFEIELPALAREGSQSGAEQAPGTAFPHAAARRRILIVEDNTDARQALADLLEIWGNEVLQAPDGLAGVSQAAALCPEVALVDIGLPGIDGYEVARRIRAGERGDRILLVALTGYGAAEQRAMAFEAGFDLHLVKPVNTQRLGAVLDDPSSCLHDRPAVSSIRNAS